MSEPVINRETIYEGAAHLILPGGTYLWCDGPVTVELVQAKLDMPVAGFGNVASPVTDETVQVTFTPSNKLDAAALAWLYGDIFAKMPGATYFGNADSSLKIHTMAGRVLELPCCRPTTFPAIQFGIGAKRVSGQVTATAILSRGATRSTAGALFKAWAALAWTAFPAESDYPQSPVSAQWALMNGVELHAADVWTVTPQINLRALTLPNLGTVDYRVDAVGCQVSATPATLAEADLWSDAALGASRVLGKNRTGGDLTLTEDNPGLTCVVKNARWITRPTRFDTQNPIAGSCVWEAVRKVENAAWCPAATIAVTAAAAQG